MKRIFALALALSLLMAACAIAPSPTPQMITPVPEETSAPHIASAPRSTVTPTPAIEAALITPSPSPAPASATLGFVGDIMMMNIQIKDARTDAGYDFSGSFLPMQGVFSSVDYLCGNFECTLSGEAAGYTYPKETPAPATEANPTPIKPFQRFNAPDALATDLVEAGFDLMTTANNHAMDKGIDGLFRTAKTLREAGLMQLGTYLDEADAMTPRVAEINGFKVGFVAAAGFLNSTAPSVPGAYRAYAVAMLSDMELIKAQIEACREAGAEFIVALVHWGMEHHQEESAAQRKYADALIRAGADAIIGGHPHVAQPMEWREVERDGNVLRAPVVYSLGNFISNMAQPNVNYGVFARLTLARDDAGRVYCAELAYLPLLCYRDTVHRVKPCFVDEAGDSMKAYAHVTKVCAGENIALLTREDVFSYAREATGNQSAQ